MKSLIVSKSAALGAAYLRVEEETFKLDQYDQLEKYEGTYVPCIEGNVVEHYTRVTFVNSETYLPADIEHIVQARNLAEAGLLEKARTELEKVSRRDTSKWIDTDQFIESERSRHQRFQGSLGAGMRTKVKKRGEIIERLCRNHPGGLLALQDEKELDTPGPGTLIRFHQLVAEYGLLPDNDFGVRKLSLTKQPRGAYAHHVGWMRELREKPARFLDVAWWVTLDVIDLFNPNEYARNSAEERLDQVPTGLRDWYAFQLEQAGVNEYDAAVQAMKELEAL